MEKVDKGLNIITEYDIMLIDKHCKFIKSRPNVLY